MIMSIWADFMTHDSQKSLWSKLHFHLVTMSLILIHFIMLVSRFVLSLSHKITFLQDRCKTFGAKPVCEILEAYSLECHRTSYNFDLSISQICDTLFSTEIRANVRLRWRMQSNCFKTCPKPFIWSDCGKPCDASCGDLDPQCEGKCVPGCRCPAGYVKVYSIFNKYETNTILARWRLH